MQDRQLLPIRYIDNDIEFQGGNHGLDWPRIWELVTDSETTRQITDTKVGLDESLPVVVCERTCDSLSSPPVKSGVKQVKIINQFLYISNCNWQELSCYVMIHFCGSLTYTQETNLHSSWHGEVKTLRRPLKIVDQKKLISSFQLLTNSGPIMLFVPMNFSHQPLKQTKLFFLLSFQLKLTLRTLIVSTGWFSTVMGPGFPRSGCI